jgi:acyl-CoA reductase-like NAD-dependent aldehyde dehydrogenase
LAPTVIEDSPAFERRLAREPQGLVLIIAPWNYPYLTTMNTVVPALIAGNAVLIKHAEQTLLVGERIAQAFHQAGLPEGADRQHLHRPPHCRNPARRRRCSTM